MVRRIAAIVALLAVLTLVGCALIGDSEESPSPEPAASSARSSTISAEQRDIRAVRGAYVDSFKELNRLEVRGGATKLTPVLLDTTSGAHRRNYLQVLRQDKRNGVHQIGRGKLAGISVGAGTERRRSVTACEDYTRVKWLKKDGSQLDVEGPLRYVQRATALKGADGKWRIDDVRTTKVSNFATAVCGAGR